MHRINIVCAGIPDGFGWKVASQALGKPFIFPVQKAFSGHAKEY